MSAERVIPMPNASEPSRSLHRKLAQVMYEAERIPKNGRAPKEMGGYPFVQVGDAADFIRKALAEKVVTMIPTAVRVVGQVDRLTKNGGNMTTVDLIVTWTLTDGESGETATIESFGAGADGGDKYSGKASTSAMKYALLSGFLLSTGDDTEAAHLPEQRSPIVAPGPVVHPKPPTHEATPDGGLIGVAQVGEAPADFQIREEPEGPAISFKLMDGRKGFRVVARDELATALAFMGQESFIGQRVTCWGRMGKASLVKNGTTIEYNVLDLDRIATADFILPSPDPVQEASVKPVQTPEVPDGASEPVVAPVETSGTLSGPAAGGSQPDALCGSPSPFTPGDSCQGQKGHTGKHVNFEGLGTSWPAR